MIKNRIVIFILGFIIWLLLSWSVKPEELLVAALAGILVAYLTIDLFPRKVNILSRPGRYLWLLYYIPVFIWECAKANLDGAYRILHPDLPLNPGIIKVKTSLKSETGITFLANTLTLKPGTMTVDVDRENGILYVHWVDVRTQDIDKATEELVVKFERILKKIFE